MTLYVGIDPGLSGGVAVASENRSGSTIEVACALPHTKEGIVDCRALWRLISPPLYKGRVEVSIERVWAMPKQGGVEKFLKNAGMLIGMCDTLGWAWKEVLPREWQRWVIGLGISGEGKKLAFNYCTKYHPSISLLRTPKCKRPSDGISDALCILDHGRICGHRSALL